MTFSANAAERSEAAMRAIAAAKLSYTREVKGMLGGTKSQMELLCVSNEKAFSVFTPESGNGFVIVAKSDKMEPVIGYGAGHFDADNIPSGLKWYLADIDEEANEMFDRLVMQFAKQEGVTEQLKADNQLLWVKQMNNIRNRAEEIVNNGIIYQ